MTTTLPEITPIALQDFSADKMEFGDDNEFIEKMTNTQSKLDAMNLQYKNGFDQMIDFRAGAQQAIDQTANDNEAASGQIAVASDRASFNLLPDHGSFLTTTAAMQSVRRNALLSNAESVAAQFNHSCMSRVFPAFNGASEAVEVGRYHTNDVGLAQTNQVAQDFMAAMVGDASVYPRYSMPWAVAEIQAGAGTAGTTDGGKYKLFNTDGLATLGDSLTISFWYRSVDSSASIRGYEGGGGDLLLAAETAQGKQVSVDGDIVANSYKGLNAGQVYHISVAYRPALVQGMNQEIFTLLGSPNTRHQFALMRVSPGLFKARVHSKPIISIQSLDPMNTSA